MMLKYILMLNSLKSLMRLSSCYPSQPILLLSLLLFILLLKIIYAIMVIFEHNVI
jgi:hypothetical protein